MKVFISKNEDESRRIAFDLGKNAKPGEVYSVTGTLGAGKTLMAKEFARGLGISDDITSPTFTILEEYPGKIPFYHFDLYRIESPEEIELMGFEDYFYGNGVSWIEWAEKCGYLLPEKHISVTIEIISDEERRITLEYPFD
ncbi:MAG: tRNA (adenosine(37)-N6)-threonylcarbamoyltransferase complex ATPase subunit type 1 TsaE [Spirochaetes bacterium]|jgi:tRNA threonylcarbamoyladenosine biosynthesis protein TsaE|nr:tRNA (adenosine(37)-N6)-threonylcarbamoyltransferase complex ATPase subunit type 1 TsaE [Spirochaetota bacterium]